MCIRTPSALRLACNVARKLEVNDQRNLKAMVKHFELLPHIISGISKRNQEIPWKVWPRAGNRTSNPKNHSSAIFSMTLLNQWKFICNLKSKSELVLTKIKKSNPYTGLDRPWGFQEAEVPQISWNRHMNVVIL